MTEKNFDKSCTFAFVTAIEWDRIHLSLTIDLVEASAENLAESVIVADASQKDLYQANIDCDDYFSVCTFLENAGPDNIIGDNHSQRQASSMRETMFVVACKGKVYAVDPSWTDEGRAVLHINVTNFNDRKFFPDGTWRIYPVTRGMIGPAASFDLRASSVLGDKSRSFLYAGNKNAYVLNFKIGENDKWPPLLLSAYSFARGRKPTELKSKFQKLLTNPVAKVRSHRKFRYAVPRKWRLRFLKCLYKMTCLVTRRSKKVVLFSSEARDRLGGNLLAINDRLIARRLDKKYTLKYHFDISGKRSLVSRLHEVILLAQADILLIDDYYPTLEHLRLHEGTKVIQAWHAGVGFKLVGYSRFGKYGSPPKTNAHRFYTYAICGSEKLRSVYAENFGIELEALVPTGLPRIDEFLSEKAKDESADEFYRSYPSVRGKKLILFAPTFRGRGMTDAYYDYDRIDFDRLYDFCGDEYVVGFRMHHFVDEPVPIRPDQSDRFINLSKYPNGLGLLHVADILITDYSSIIYEYSLLNKPILFYAYDLSIYETIRGFDRDYNATAPGRVCLDFDTLIQALETDDYGMDKLEEYRSNNFDYIDTNASDRVIDWLIEEQLPDVYGHKPAIRFTNEHG